MGTRSFIFLSGKLLYFVLGLCDYSDKFPKMFCVKIDIVYVKKPRFGFESLALLFAPRGLNLSWYSMFSVPVVRIKVLNNKKINRLWALKASTAQSRYRGRFSRC